MTSANNTSPGTPENSDSNKSEPVVPIQAGPSPTVIEAGTAPSSQAAPAAPATKEDELIGSWLTAHLDKVDRPFKILILVLAFILGSFAAANADVFLYLATGRLLSEGKYQFGVDPFAFTTEGTAQSPAIPWVNHSWLFSWLFYLFYDGTGFTLVVIKAACATLLAAVLLLIRPRFPHGWVSIVGVLLIMLALSPRLVMQPTVISFLFLGLTLLILHRAGVLAGPDEPAYPKLLWLFPLLFALWVNLDVWFILGPLVLVLCLLAAPWQHHLGQPARVAPGYLAAVLGVGILVCLANNPHHVQALVTLPPELGYMLLSVGDFWPESMVSGGRALLEFQRNNPRFAQTLSAFSFEYLGQTSQGLNVAGISFFLLLALSVGSFFYLAGAGKKPIGPGFSGARLVLVVVFGILALWQVRLLPFCALIAGTVAILNLQEYLLWRENNNAGKIEEQKLWGNLARLVTAFLLFGLYFLAWPGWVNHTIGDFSSPRRVAYNIEVDPFLKQTAEYLGQMHQEGKLTRGLNLVPQIGHYCAWFAPDVKCFYDYRFQLFVRDIPKVNSVFRGLQAETDPDMARREKSAYDWQEVFRQYGIDHLIGADFQEQPRDRTLVGRLTQWCWLDGPEFEAVYADGRVLVAAWKKSGKPLPPSVTEIWHKQAFGKEAVVAHPGGKNVAAPLEEDPGFWRLYLLGQKRLSMPAQQARLYLDYFDFLKGDPRWRRDFINAWSIISGALPAGLATGPLVQDALVYIPWDKIGFNPFNIFGRDKGPPDAPLLALRATWEALADDPQDARSYQLLARACNLLATEQENHWTGYSPRSNLRARIRNIQYVSALKNFLQLKPQDPQVHWLLAEYFLQQNYLDLALDHMQQSVAHLVAVPGSQAEIVQLKAARENQMIQLEREVNARLNALDQRTAKDKDLEKVQVALFRPYDFTTPDNKTVIDPRGMGLPLKALQILDGLHLEVLSDAEKQQVLAWRFHLLMQTGTLWQVAQGLPFAGEGFDPGMYAEFRLLLGAGTGDYAKADEALADLDTIAQNQEKKVTLEAANQLLRPTMFFALPQSAPPIPLLAYPPFYQMVLRGNEILTGYRLGKAERALVRGLLTLEAGNPELARTYFQQALDLAQPRLPLPDRRIARRYLEILKTP